MKPKWSFETFAFTCVAIMLLVGVVCALALVVLPLLLYLGVL